MTFHVPARFILPSARLQLVPLLQDLAGGAKALENRLDELSRQSLLARKMVEQEALRWEKKHLVGRCDGIYASPQIRREEFPLLPFLKEGAGSVGDADGQTPPVAELVREELLHRFVTGKRKCYFVRFIEKISAISLFFGKSLHEILVHLAPFCGSSRLLKDSRLSPKYRLRETFDAHDPLPSPPARYITTPGLSCEKYSKYWTRTFAVRTPAASDAASGRRGAEVVPGTRGWALLTPSRYGYDCRLW